MRAPAPTITTILVACLAAFSLSACAPPAPEPSPTATGFASEEEAFAAAEETYRAYVDALNDVDLADPQTFEPLFALTTGELNDLDRRTFSEMHAAGQSVSGETRILAINGLRSDGNEVDIESCIDVSNVDVRDANGTSLVSADRPDRQLETISLVRNEAGDVRLQRIDTSDVAATCEG
ncbi:hypothetical protein BKA24_002289 [Microbacterium marinum]|uniref:Nuclear transport factor 2 family protein n=1 Tax=Microbacterium marinum TaxID=421115 RepID=A0A7W7FJM2_9MICO|nr:hypothetical protein [Microbacterium marinum]MBB4667580.1 hypothetical protein [Microbacterium marinum]